MSNKNKFLRKGLFIASSSVAAAGSLFSAVGAQANDDVIAEKELEEVLAKNLWYVILNFLNIRGLFKEKIEKIEKETKANLIKEKETKVNPVKEKEEMVNPIKEKEEMVNLIKKKLSMFLVSKDISKWREFKVRSSEGEMIDFDLYSNSINGVLEIGKVAYVYCYDRSSETHTLLRLNESFSPACYNVISSFSEKNTSLEDIKKFYEELTNIYYESRYNKVCKEFYDFLEKESKEQPSGLFEKNKHYGEGEDFLGGEIFDFKFNCFINGEKLNYVYLAKENIGAEIKDICVVYNFGKKGVRSGRYRAGGEEGDLSKAEMTKILEDIMKQAGNELKNEENNIDLANNVVSNDK